MLASATWYWSFLTKVAQQIRRPTSELEHVQANQRKRIMPKLTSVEVGELASTLFFDMFDRPTDEFLAAFGLWDVIDCGGGVLLYLLQQDAQKFQGTFGNCIVITDAIKAALPEATTVVSKILELNGKTFFSLFNHEIS